MEFEQTRTWAECSESAFLGNIRAVRQMLKNTKLLGVVKANAYGHGAVRAAKLLGSEGAAGLAVSTLPEAVELREAGIKLPVLVLGPTEPLFFDELVSHDLTQTVADPGFAERYSQAAVKSGRSLKCHLKLDTGMGRLGFTEPAEALKAVFLRGLTFEGAYSHFAVSDEPGGAEYSLGQLEKFRGLVREIELAGGVKFPVLHMANSGGVENFPQSYLDMARPGIVLYGYPASGKRILGINPVMELKTRVVQVKQLEKGDSVSYGRRYIADRPILAAVLPVGYADGLSRSLTNEMSVLINGKKAVQVGTICMDMCMVDVTGIPGAEAGSVATLFGREPGFTARDMAELRGTIPYEVLCNVSERVPRIWVK